MQKSKTKNSRRRRLQLAYVLYATGIEIHGHLIYDDKYKMQMRIRIRRAMCNVIWDRKTMFTRARENEAHKKYEQQIECALH